MRVGDLETHVSHSLSNRWIPRDYGTAPDGGGACLRARWSRLAPFGRQNARERSGGGPEETGLDGGVAFPGGVHVGILATESHQLVVATEFDDAATVDHRNAVGPHGRGE